MTSIFGRLKGNSTPASSSIGISPSKKSAVQTPSTPLERWLAESGPLRGDGHDKFFGMHNASNTCYCNSVVQCLYFSESFREQVINFPRPGQKQSAAQHDPNIARVVNGTVKDNANGTASEPQAAQKSAANQTQSSQPENKESFDYQKKLALAAGPHLRLEQGLFQTYGMPESLFTSLKDLFEAIIAHESRIGIVAPAKFLEVLRRNHEIFRSNVHQDAHEFLNILLNEVVEQVEAYSKNMAKDSGTAAGLGLSIPSGPSQTQQNSQTTSSWVHELFEGTLTSETRCLTCENISQRDEAFLDLSVDLEEHSSVTSCLRKFSEEEMLCERNKFHCDKCSGLQEAEKRMKVKRLPRILALHLKRFKFIEEIGNFRKLFHRVVYPFHLRLLNTTDDAEDPDRLYELYAVVVHLGSTPFHGHYVSIIKTKDRGWLLFDDELVLPVNKEYVRNFFGGDPRNPACAYVLFYQETSIESVLREQETEDEPGNIPTVEGFDIQGIMATDEDGAASPTLTADTAPTPAIEEGDAFASLEHSVTAPAVPASHDEELTALPVANPWDRPPSSEEPRTPSKSQGSVMSGHMNRLRHTSMNLRSKPKFWSSKDKSADGVTDEAEGTDVTSPQRETAPVLPVEKPERAKSTRFSLVRKKAPAQS